MARWSRAFAAAFRATLPILTGFLFLGAAYGIYMKAYGMGPIVSLATSITVFAGSLQFAAARSLASSFAPFELFAMSLLLGARHIFYGISLLDRYRPARGAAKLCLVHMMCDETFTVNCGTEPPDGVDRTAFMLAVSVLDYSYWIGGTAIGAIAGELVRFDSRGIDFVLTSLFIVMFVEGWLSEADHRASLLGLAMTAACLAIFGPANFIVFAMAGMLAVLLIFRRRFEGAAS